MRMLTTSKRTHSCGELRRSDAGKKVLLSGWVNKRRDLGGLIFVDIRDRYGMTQVFFDPEGDGELFAAAEKLKSEYVVAVEGTVSARPDGMVNASMDTGEIEVLALSLTVLNTCEVLPFNMTDQESADENLRMKYRYLDLRRPSMANRLRLRHKVAKTVRDYFDERDFLEVETPMLVRSTPEGARDYLVPSRVHSGEVYALPQSPQLLKQILMVGGVDRYFQLAKCFRDEDLRADRQPEFTQIDVEMSFVGRDDVLSTVEGMLREVFRKALNTELPDPFPRMTWSEAMERYGSDKPDLRYGMEIQDVTEQVGTTGFKVFDGTIESGGRIKCIVVPEKGALSRKESDSVIEFSKTTGLSGVVVLAFHEGRAKSVLTKFISEEALNRLKDHVGAGDGDLVLFAAGESRLISQGLGRMRLEMAERFQLKPSSDFAFLWVMDFPMYSYNEEEGRLEAEHHPFTSPLEEDAHLIETQPLKVRSNAYDIVLNGVELGSGSIRIHDRTLQERIFKAMGLDGETAGEKFGFLLQAFDYGAPPHGGIALGLDRLTAIMSGTDSIRDVIAFPKNHQAICPLTEAPVVPSQQQLDLLKIRFAGEIKS